MSAFLEELKTIKEGQKQLRERVGLLKQLNVVRTGPGVLELDKGITFRTIYKDNATVTIAHYPKMGARTPSHCHKDVKEYLICSKGSLNVSFNNMTRTIKIRECVSIPEGCLHSTTALEDNSELIAVCVPVESLYAASMTCL